MSTIPAPIFKVHNSLEDFENYEPPFNTVCVSIVLNNPDSTVNIHLPSNREKDNEEMSTEEVALISIVMYLHDKELLQDAILHIDTDVDEDK